VAKGRRLLLGSLAAATLLSAPAAHAVDLPVVGGKPVRLDVTETSIAQQHFDARTAEGENAEDQGYGAWLNRLNAALRWKEWTVATRLDSSIYWLRPEDRPQLFSDAARLQNARIDGSSRFRDAIYPAKLWATYQAGALEVTAGDAYVQFGRGLTLSMRKVDELGIDNTIRGAKVALQKDPFALTLIAGLANPSRVDEANGRALFLPSALAGDTRGPQPLFGSDRIVGAQIQAGRGLPFVLGTHAVRITRCAPYGYDASGRVVDGAFDAPFGSCEPTDTNIWLSTLSPATPTITASEVTMAGQTLEIPNLFGHGSLYVEAATQHRFHDNDPNDKNAMGNALYGALSTKFGVLTNTLEWKSYRNFYPVAGSVDVRRAVQFNNIVYNSVPTAELITQDSMFGFYNACVDGARLRSDVRLSDAFLVYGALGYFYTRSEVTGGACDERGSTVVGASVSADSVHNDVYDALSGFEWQFDGAKSQFLMSSGVRDDETRSGDVFYRELHGEYSFNKYIAGPVSLELSGRHRLRREQHTNLIDGFEQAWREGQHYTQLKVAPKWVFAQGIEYTSLSGQPTYYFNGSVLYRFSSESNLRVFVGQQRGGLKCVSGVCKIFPPYEGVRAELTLRF
jgi:hypothetical protein